MYSCRLKGTSDQASSWVLTVVSRNGIKEICSQHLKKIVLGCLSLKLLKKNTVIFKKVVRAQLYYVCQSVPVVSRRKSTKAEVAVTSWANLFVLITSKEQTSMAARWGAQIWNRKVLLLHKWFYQTNKKNLPVKLLTTIFFFQAKSHLRLVSLRQHSSPKYEGFKRLQYIWFPLFFIFIIHPVTSSRRSWSHFHGPELLCIVGSSVKGWVLLLYVDPVVECM